MTLLVPPPDPCKKHAEPEPEAVLYTHPPDLLKFQPDLVRFDQFQVAMSHNLDIICYILILIIVDIQFMYKILSKNAIHVICHLTLHLLLSFHHYHCL